MFIGWLYCVTLTAGIFVTRVGGLNRASNALTASQAPATQWSHGWKHDDDLVHLIQLTEAEDLTRAVRAKDHVDDVTGYVERLLDAARLSDKQLEGSLLTQPGFTADAWQGALLLGVHPGQHDIPSSPKQTTAVATETEESKMTVAERNSGVEDDSRSPDVERMEATAKANPEQDIFSVVFGVLMSVFALTLMIINEHQAAQASSLISFGRKECHAHKLRHGEGLLVHFHGAMTAAHSIDHPDFENCRIDGKFVKLRTRLEVFQYVEVFETGVVTYQKTWSSDMHSSLQYQDQFKQNKFDVIPKESLHSCPRVSLEGFIMPDGFVDHMDVEDYWEPATQMLGETVHSRSDGLDMHKIGDYFYHQHKEGEDSIGDARVKFDVVPDGMLVSVLALQGKLPDDSDDWTFYPYRSVDRGGFCGTVNDDQLKERLMEQAIKTKMELHSTDHFASFPLGLMCFLCVSARSCLTVLFTLPKPEIYLILVGEYSKDQMFKQVPRVPRWKVYVFGITSHLALFIGTWLLASTFLKASQDEYGHHFFVVTALYATFALHCFLVAACHWPYQPRRSLVAMSLFILMCVGLHFAVQAVYGPRLGVAVPATSVAAPVAALGAHPVGHLVPIS